MSIKLTLKKKNRIERRESLSVSTSLLRLSQAGVKLYFVALLSLSLFLTSILPHTKEISAVFTKEVEANNIERPDFLVENSEKKKTKRVKKISLEDKYRSLAGVYYYSNVEPHLPVIDKVLVQNGLDNDALFIQAMFYIGQHESHWNPYSISSTSVGGEHPTGLFQFLPSTYYSVGRGDMFDAENQIWAFVAMAQRGRLREFGTLYIGGLNPVVKSYALSYKNG